jgi:hypothetical protein
MLVKYECARECITRIQLEQQRDGMKFKRLMSKDGSGLIMMMMISHGTSNEINEIVHSSVIFNNLFTHVKMPANLSGHR